MNTTPDPDMRRKLEQIKSPIARIMITLLICALLLYDRIQNIPLRWVIWQAELTKKPRRRTK